MRVLCLLESLRSGGAERQMCTLAAEMKRRGIDVTVGTYHRADFYLPLLEKAGVEHQVLAGGGRIGRVLAVRRAVRSGKHDVVLAFLSGPCTYAELAALPSRRWGLVVSERVAWPHSLRWRYALLWKLHVLADYVTTNSHANRLQVERAVPRLAARIVTIYNTVDLEQFRPARAPRRGPADSLGLAVAATYEERKNLAGLIQAVAALKEQTPKVMVRVTWHGSTVHGSDYYNECTRMIHDYGLADQFGLHPPTQDVSSVYQCSDAVILPSFFEGLPNVVCEAMACGRPILMSAVCDAGNLVKEGRNGFLFDPAEPASIAAAITRFAALGAEERADYGHNSRQMAEHLFDMNMITDKYVAVLEAAARRERIPVNHWAPEIPTTAHNLD